MQKNLKTNANNLSENGIQIVVRKSPDSDWLPHPEFEFQILEDGELVKEGKYYGTYAAAMLAVVTWMGERCGF